MFQDFTVKDLCSLMASSSPTPGGGTAGALISMYGVSLLEMVINLSKSKKLLAHHLPVYDEFLSMLTNKRVELAKQMDIDTSSFNEVLAAFKLPKNTREEEMRRGDVIQAAYVEAAHVPMKTAQLAYDSLTIATNLLGIVNKNVVSDLLVGAEMCFTGIRGALINVAINSVSIKDSKIKDNFIQGINELNVKSMNLISKIHAFFSDSIFKEILKK